jgi:hypothetical protein
VVVRFAFREITPPFIEMLPATVTGPVAVTFPAVELRVKDCVALVEITAFETVIAPEVCKVALAELIWLCKEVGVTREVPSVAVYQVPPIQAPVASTTPAVSTVIDCGNPRVRPEVLVLSKESW